MKIAQISLVAAFLVCPSIELLACSTSLTETQAFLRSLGKDSSIDELKALSVLDLGNKCVSDDQLKNLCPLKSLTSLSLYNDNCGEHSLTGGTLNELNEMNELLELDLDGNRITANNLHLLKGLNKLSELKLFSNQVKGKEIAALNDLPALTTLILDKNNLEDSDLDNIAHLDHLQVLALRRNRLKGENLKALVKINSLEELYLGNEGYQSPVTEIKNSIDLSHLADLTSMPNLKILSLQNGMAPGIFPTGIRFTKLKNLNVSQRTEGWSKTDFQALLDFVHTNRISILKLSSSKLTDEMLIGLSQLEDLERLDIGVNTQLTLNGLSSFKNHPNLTTIGLSFQDFLRLHIESGFDENQNFVRPASWDSILSLHCIFALIN